MKKILCILFVMAAVSAVMAENENKEEGPWKFEGFISQQLNQVSFSNWAAGGENNFTTTSIFNLSGVYEKDRNSWENKLDLAYGFIRTGDTPARKSTDRIKFLSKYARKMTDKLSLAALADFQSQFAKGYKYPDTEVVISKFLSPGFLTTSVGLEYKPVDYFSVYLSPAAGKFTFVTDPDLSAAGAFGVPAGEKVNPEFGAYASITFDKEVFENVKIASKLDLFNNFTDSDKDNRKRIDVNWLTGVNMKINRFLSASLGLHLIYDHDISSDVQLHQMLGVGFSYSF